MNPEITTTSPSLNHNQRAVLLRLSCQPAGVRQIKQWPMPAQWAVEHLLRQDLVQGKVIRITDTGRAALEAARI